jgi:hypothetical protein
VDHYKTAGEGFLLKPGKKNSVNPHVKCQGQENMFI